MAALLALIALSPVEGPAAPGDYDLAKTGLTWVKGLEAAKSQGKPVLLFQLLGDFDDTYC